MSNLSKEIDMTRQRPPIWAFAIVAVLVLFGIGSAIHNAGWSDGFATGLLASNADGGKLAPYLLYQNGYGGHHWGIGGFFGGLFHFVFFLFFLGFIAKVIGFWRCRMNGGQHGGWHQHWQHGGHPDWHQRWQQGQSQPQQSSSAPGSAPTATPQPDEHKPQNTAWINV
jgi:hypothetical protein